MVVHRLLLRQFRGGSESIGGWQRVLWPDIETDRGLVGLLEVNVTTSQALQERILQRDPKLLIELLICICYT